MFARATLAAVSLLALGAGGALAAGQLLSSGGTAQSFRHRPQESLTA
jgi:hypothetical protein